MKKENILTAVGVVGVIGIFGAMVYVSIKEAEELRNYKASRMKDFDFEKEIINASIENDRLDTASVKYDAKKVLNFYYTKMKGSNSKSSFDNLYYKLKKMIIDFQVDSAVACNVAVMEAVDEMIAEIASEEAVKAEKKRQEEMKRQEENYQKLADAISGKK